jgi:tetratricopeptide (TPR) repeat protein
MVAEGLSVWRDETEIPDFGDIPDAMCQGVRAAHAVVAYYDDNFAERRACQWELTEALVASAHDATGARGAQGRALVITPTDQINHVRPRALRGELMMSLADHEPNEIARAVRLHVEKFAATIGGARRPRAHPWVGIAEHAVYGRFVGRITEMWDIFDALSADVVVLHGRAAAAPRGGMGSAHLHAWGGVGKSLLAAEYARRFNAFYPGGVFWSHAGGRDEAWRLTAWIALRRAAAALNMNIAAFDALMKDHPEPAEAFAEARTLVGLALATRGLSYLWIVDDLREGASREERESWMAPDDQGLGRTLFTTRDGAHFETGVAIEIGMLDGPSAYDLLTFSRKPASTEEEADARRFLTVVDHYALIVDVAGRLLGSGYFTSFAELLRTASHPELDARVLDLEGGLRLELPGGANPNIIATLLRSFDFLVSLSGGALALDILRIASLLQPQTTIPHDLLNATLNEDLAKARHHLRDLALADVDARGLTVHPVISRAVALSSANEQLVALRAKAVSVLIHRLESVDEVEHFRSQDRLVSHATALLREIASLDDAILLGRVAGHHYVAGRGAIAEALFRRQLQVLEGFFAEDHPDVLTCRANLAGALRLQAKFGEAAKLQCLVLSLSRAALGREHPDTLSALNNYAETLRAQGDLDNALALHREALEARSRSLGGKHPATLTSMSNLAGLLHSRGDLEEALAMRRRICNLYGANGNDAGYDALVAGSNLAETLRVLDRHADARPLQLSVVAGLSRLLGEDHPDTLTARGNLALMDAALGDLERAREAQEQLLELRLQANGQDHPATLGLQGNLADTLLKLDRVDEALALVEQTARASERVLGADHPATLNAVNNLAAIVHREANDLETARELFDRVVKARTRVLGAKHHATLTSMTNLAGVLKDLNDLPAARDHYRRAVEGFRETLGGSHACTRIALRGYALTLEEANDYPAARPVHELLVAFQTQFLGESHRDTLETMNDLAAVLFQLGDLSGARQLLEKAMSVSRHAFGEKDPVTLIFKNNLGGFFTECGHHAAARELREQVLAARLEALGPRHSSSITSMNLLAETLLALGDHQAAEALWTQALSAAGDVLGENHEYTQFIRQALSQCLSEKSNLDPS